MDGGLWKEEIFCHLNYKNVINFPFVIQQPVSFTAESSSPLKAIS